MSQINAIPSRDVSRIRRRVRYITRIGSITQLPSERRKQLRQVTKRYPFRSNNYYLNLIDWHDPRDPIRQLIVPRIEELNGQGDLDASNEAAYTVAPGVQHKYPDTAVLLCSQICGGLCRYCFRKRLFMDADQNTTVDTSKGLEYIASHPEITNVLLTGGDPLGLDTSRLTELLSALRAIPHVKIIRIGTKMPAFNPWRVLGDRRLQDALRRHSTSRQRIYIMTHFDHPRELTDLAIECVDRLIRCGVICANQCPVIRGVNDDPTVLAELYRNLSWIGCPPYYLFQMRPTAGNEPYAVPIVRGWEIFCEALRHGSGLARRARYVMSHETGKIEIVGVDDDHVYLHYQRAKDPLLRGRFLTYQRDDDAFWLDQLVPVQNQNALRAVDESCPQVQDQPAILCD